MVTYKKGLNKVWKITKGFPEVTLDLKSKA